MSRRQLSLARRCSRDSPRQACRVPSLRPRYDALTAGIVHFGVGNFHRAHQAVYLDDLFNAGRDHDWAHRRRRRARRRRRKMRDKLAGAGLADHRRRAGQPATSGARVTGADDRLPAARRRRAPSSPRSPIPAIRIVSLTITEGGYFIDPAPRQVRPGRIPASSPTPRNPDDAEDRVRPDPRRPQGAAAPPASRPSPSCPATTSRTTATSPRTPSSASPRLIDPSFADWVRDNVAFPNGMVDRITPATADRERDHLASEFGIEDAWPVFCEDFKQWVLEDNFPAGRPALEKVGVAVRRRRRALRADEDPHPQWRPRDHRLSGRR